jgi:hypothetical protein
MVQLKHNTTGKVHSMNEKQYNKMVGLGQTFHNYTRVIDAKKLVLEIEKELKIQENTTVEEAENINKTNESLTNNKKNKKNDL